MFYYGDVEVTLENYKEVFEGYIPDVLDEIRLALLDDVAIGGYVKYIGNDSYKLGQFRLAIREMVPAEYLDLDFTGKTMFYIRQCHKLNIDISPLLSYVGKLSYQALEVLSEFCYINVDITKLDFTKVSEKLIPLYAYGLANGVPMWLLVNCEVQTEEYLKLLMQGLRRGFDMHPFLSNSWDMNAIKYLFGLGKEDYDSILRVINHTVSRGEVEALKKCKSVGVDLKKVAIKDDDGYLIYDEYQLDAIAEVVSKGCPLSKVLNPRYSAREILSILN